MAASSENMCDLEKNKQTRNVDKNLLDLFWDLSKIAQPLRLQSAVSLIRLLYEKQTSLDKNNEVKSSELEYAVERLVRGLASSREAARQGFCLVLTEILRLFPVVTVEDIVKSIEKDLSFRNKMEKCPTVIGRVLVYAAIIRSERLKNDPYVSFIVNNLYELSIGKAYIQQIIYAMILDLFSQIDSEHFQNSIWPHMKKNLNCGWDKCTPDSLWYLLISIRFFPDAIASKFLKKHWDGENLLTLENATHWQQLIKQSTSVHPQLHPLCSEFLSMCIKNKCLQEFWNIVVDDNLFETDHSEKAYLGFLMVRDALSKTKKKKKIVKSILSPNFCHALIKAYLNVKHPLHSAANELVLFLSKYVSDCTDYQIQAIVMKVFLFQSPAHAMGQILKKKEIITMISNFTAETVHVFYEILKEIIFMTNEKNDDANAGENRKPHVAVLQIRSLVSHQAVITDDTWKMGVVKFLFLYSFFNVKEPIEDLQEANHSSNHFPLSLRISFVQSFTKALDNLHWNAESPSLSLKQRLNFLSEIIKYADSLLQMNHPSLSPLFLAEKIMDSWEHIKSISQKIRKQGKKENKKDQSYPFQILFLELGLLLFQDPDNIPNVVEELEVCYKNAKLKKKESTNDDETPSWIEVIIDILLSLLSQSSQHMRCIVNNVFPLVCPFMTSDAFQLILDVINPEKGDNPLVNEESDDEDNDVEFESGSSSDDNDEEDNNEIDKEFKFKLQKVLGTKDDVSEAESDEVILSDSEMFKLDNTLSEVFRSRKKTGHSQQTGEQKSLMQFRIRCFDLVVTYLKSQPPLHIVLQIIKPVLSTYEGVRHQRQYEPLIFRALSMLKFLAKTKKFSNYDGVTSSNLQELLREIIAKAHSEKDIRVGGILYSLCIFLVLCERRLKTSDEDIANQEVKLEELDTVKLYLTALNDFITKTTTHIIPEMFLSLMKTCPETAWMFIKPLQKYSLAENVRLYRKSQSLGLLLSAIKLSKSNKQVSSEMWIKISKSLLDKLSEALKSTLEAPEFKPLYTTGLLSTLAAVCQILKDKEPSVLQSYSQLVPILLSINSKKYRKLTKDGNLSRKQLIGFLGGELTKKRKREDSTHNTDETIQNNISENIGKKNKKMKIDTKLKMNSDKRKEKKVKETVRDEPMSNADDEEENEESDRTNSSVNSSDSENDS